MRERDVVLVVSVTAAVVAALAVLLLAAPAALAAPPPNDDFADAQVLTGTSAAADGTTVEATKETGEPMHDSADAERSVWYRWTAPEDGVAIVDTAGSASRTTLGVYTGPAVDALAPVAAVLDTHTFTIARTKFRAVGGRTFDGQGARGRRRPGPPHRGVHRRLARRARAGRDDVVERAGILPGGSRDGLQHRRGRRRRSRRAVRVAVGLRARASKRRLR
jgi:hypothetical protein